MYWSYLIILILLLLNLPAFSQKQQICLLKKGGTKTKNKKTHKNWFDSDLKQLRLNLINYGKVYSKYPNDPLVKNHAYKLYREYNKCRKAKKKLYKSKLLHELETLHKDNPKLYWKMINDLQDKSYDSEDNCIPPSRWLKHFQSLNTVQEHFLPRIQQLKAKLESQNQQFVLMN